MVRPGTPPDRGHGWRPATRLEVACAVPPPPAPTLEPPGELSMPEAVIADAIRTPIGRAGRGSLKTVRADDLAAIPIRALIERNPEVDFAQTTDVMMGAASAVGEQGYNVGPNASLLAGLDHHVPACTVNRFCASSLMSIRMAFHAIKAGEGEQYIAAGVEAVSRAGLGAGMMDEAKNHALDG